MIVERLMMRRVAAALLVIAVVLPMTSVLASDGHKSTSAPSQQVNFIVYTLDNAKLRTGPGVSYEIITTIPFSTPLSAIGRNDTGAWILVDNNGQQGWVYGQLLEFTGPTFNLPVVDTVLPGPGGSGDTDTKPKPPTPTPSSPEQPQPPAPSGPVTVTTKNTMNLRTAPSTAGATITRIPAGTALTPTGRSADGQWVFVPFGSSKGWLAAWLATVTGDLNSLPITTESGCCAPPPTSGGSIPPSGAGSFELGGQTPSLDHPSQMHTADMTWVKFQNKWFPGQSPYDLTARIQLAHANGFKVLFSIPGPEYPSSIDYNSYVQFVAGVAGQGADAIEIWNEMNLDREWPTGQISPATYVNSLLAPSYHAIKSTNPGTLVIAGALAPTGVDNGYSVWADNHYLAGMAGAGAAQFMDCLGVHHNAGATSPDATTGHPADAGDHHYSWYFQPTFNVYASAFPSKKLCFTELGYVSGEGIGAMPPNFWWGGGNTVGEQAEWLARAVTISRQSGKVRLLIVFNVDFTTWGDDPQAGYAIVRPDGGCPACYSLGNAMK